MLLNHIHLCLDAIEPRQVLPCANLQLKPDMQLQLKPDMHAQLNPDNCRDKNLQSNLRAIVGVN